MWDFSWILRHHRFGEFEDWDKVLDELADRGYNAIRMDCMPQFVAREEDGSIREEFYFRKDSWKPALWGNNVSMYIRPHEALLEFIPKCKKRGIKIGISAWFLKHGTDRQFIFSDENGLYRAWDETLTFLDKHGMLDDILYVDILNEYPFWHGFEWLKNEFHARSDITKFKENNPDAHIPDLDQAEAGKFNPLQKEFFNKFQTTLLNRMKDKWPSLDFFVSIDSGMPLTEIDMSSFGALDYHVWFVHNSEMGATGYSAIHSMKNDHEFKNAYTSMMEFWRKNRTRLIDWMDGRMSAIAKHASAHAIPCGNTEGWGPISWIDHPALDWEWVKESGEI